MERIHTFPEALGRVAREAAPKRLMTTHMAPATVPDELKARMARDFKGSVVIGEDLMEVSLDRFSS